MPRMEVSQSAMFFLEADPAQLDAQLALWTAPHPAIGLLAMLPEALKDRLPVLQQACRARGLPLAGAIFPALINGASFRTDGLWLLRLDEQVPAFLLADLPPDAQAAADHISDAAEALLSRQNPQAMRPTLFLVFDGLLPHISSVLDSVYLRLADRVEYAGVNAGSETFLPMPCLFDQDRVVGNGVLGLFLPGRAATTLAHGYPVPEQCMSATSTIGNQILSIDWRPAFEVYREIVQAAYGVALTRENFYQLAVHFPFGIVRANQEVVVRIPVVLGDDGALHCVGEVPENAMLVLLRAPDAPAAQCVGTLVEALAGARGMPTGGQLMLHYSAGRRMHLGAAAEQELAQLQRDSGAACMAGALSLGEIGSTRAWGYPTFHNASMVCTPWPTT